MKGRTLTINTFKYFEYCNANILLSTQYNFPSIKTKQTFISLLAFFPSYSIRCYIPILIIIDKPRIKQIYLPLAFLLVVPCIHFLVNEFSSPQIHNDHTQHLLILSHQTQNLCLVCLGAKLLSHKLQISSSTSIIFNLVLI